MTTAQREARTFLAQFHHRPFSISDLKKALQAQGFSLVEYSRTSNCKEVTTLLTALRLFDYAASQSAFTYQDTNLRIVFILENLSQQEQMVLLSHELGHILCHHLDHAPITGPGTGVLQEQEANEFSADLMRYNQRCKPRRIALGGGRYSGGAGSGVRPAVCLAGRRQRNGVSDPVRKVLPQGRLHVCGGQGQPHCPLPAAGGGRRL